MGGKCFSKNNSLCEIKARNTELFFQMPPPSQQLCEFIGSRLCPCALSDEAKAKITMLAPKSVML